MLSRIISPLSFSSKPFSAKDTESKFTLQHLKALYSDLTKNKVVDSKNYEMVVEILRDIAEMVVYGDRKSELLFDFFCEKNMLALIVEIAKSVGEEYPKVNIQILQTLCILIQSVEQETSLYYILSNHYINRLLQHPFQLQVEDILAHYCTLLKSLSLRLNPLTLQFFIIEQTNEFPLLNKAIELLLSDETMITTAAQTVILRIFQIQDPLIYKYVFKYEPLYALFSTITELFSIKYLRFLTFISTHFQLNHLHYKNVIDIISINSEISNADPSHTSNPDINNKNNNNNNNNNSSSSQASDKGKGNLNISENANDQLNQIHNVLEDTLYFVNDLLSHIYQTSTTHNNNNNNNNNDNTHSNSHDNNDHNPHFQNFIRSFIRHVTVHFIYPNLLDSFILKDEGVSVTPRSRSSSLSTTTSENERRRKNSKKDGGINTAGGLSAVAVDSNSRTNRQFSQLSSLYFLIQMLRVVKNREFHRAVVVALFLPISRKHRKYIFTQHQHRHEVKLNRDKSSSVMASDKDYVSARIRSMSAPVGVISPNPKATQTPHTDICLKQPDVFSDNVEAICVGLNGDVDVDISTQSYGSTAVSDQSEGSVVVSEEGNSVIPVIENSNNTTQTAKIVDSSSDMAVTDEVLDQPESESPSKAQISSESTSPAPAPVPAVRELKARQVVNGANGHRHEPRSEKNTPSRTVPLLPSVFEHFSHDSEFADNPYRKGLLSLFRDCCLRSDEFLSHSIAVYSLVLFESVLLTQHPVDQPTYCNYETIPEDKIDDDKKGGASSSAPTSVTTEELSVESLKPMNSVEVEGKELILIPGAEADSRSDLITSDIENMSTTTGRLVTREGLQPIVSFSSFLIGGSLLMLSPEGADSCTPISESLGVTGGGEPNHREMEAMDGEEVGRNILTDLDAESGAMVQQQSSSSMQLNAVNSTITPIVLEEAYVNKTDSAAVSVNESSIADLSKGKAEVAEGETSTLQGTDPQKEVNSKSNGKNDHGTGAEAGLCTFVSAMRCLLQSTMIWPLGPEEEDLATASATASDSREVLNEEVNVARGTQAEGGSSRDKVNRERAVVADLGPMEEFAFWDPDLLDVYKLRIILRYYSSNSKRFHSLIHESLSPPMLSVTSRLKIPSQLIGVDSDGPPITSLRDILLRNNPLRPSIPSANSLVNLQRLQTEDSTDSKSSVFLLVDLVNMLVESSSRLDLLQRICVTVLIHMKCAVVFKYWPLLRGRALNQLLTGTKVAEKSLSGMLFRESDGPFQNQFFDLLQIARGRSGDDQERLWKVKTDSLNSLFTEEKPFPSLISILTTKQEGEMKMKLIHHLMSAFLWIRALRKCVQFYVLEVDIVGTVGSKALVSQQDSNSVHNNCQNGSFPGSDDNVGYPSVSYGEDEDRLNKGDCHVDANTEAQSFDAEFIVQSVYASLKKHVLNETTEFMSFDQRCDSPLTVTDGTMTRGCVIELSGRRCILCCRLLVDPSELVSALDVDQEDSIMNKSPSMTSMDISPDIITSNNSKTDEHRPPLPPPLVSLTTPPSSPIRKVSTFASPATASSAMRALERGTALMNYFTFRSNRKASVSAEESNRLASEAAKRNGIEAFLIIEKRYLFLVTHTLATDSEHDKGVIQVVADVMEADVSIEQDAHDVLSIASPYTDNATEKAPDLEPQTLSGPAVKTVDSTLSALSSSTLTPSMNPSSAPNIPPSSSAPAVENRAYIGSNQKSRTRIKFDSDSSCAVAMELITARRDAIRSHVLEQVQEYFRGILNEM